MKKHFNRFLSYFLVFAMILASISPIGVAAEEAEGENIAGLYATMDVEWDDAAQKNYVRDDAAYHSELYSWVSGANMHFVMRDEQGNETPITDTSSIYAFTEEENPTEAITFGHSNDGDGIVTLSFHDVGVYQIGFESYEGYTLRLVVEYSPIGFYSQDTVSAAANLFDYNYSNLGGESFYLVPREEASNEDITVSDNSLFKVTYWNESAGENVEVTDTEELKEFITWTKGTGENDIPEGVYKIDVAQGCATEFALSAFCTDTWYTDEDRTEISGEPTREEAFLFLHYEYVPDGLVGTLDLDFEDVVPKLADDPYFAEQLDASMPWVNVALKYISRDGAGEVTEEFLTSKDIIVFDENDDEVTEDVVTWGKHPDASEDYYIEFIFNQAGDYKIGY